jgi:hypothetical protein
VNEHLSDDQLVGYAHHTLTDAERESMRKHLSVCQDCRTLLASVESVQRRIRHSLAADIRAASASRSMTFAEIAPRINPAGLRAWIGLLGHPASLGVTALAAAVGLTLALGSLLQSQGWASGGTSGVTGGLWPLLSCGCFAIALGGNAGLQSVISPRLVLVRLFALTLWLGTALLGLQVIIVLFNVLVWLTSGGLDPVLAATALLPLSIGWIVLVVGGGEYHYVRVGQQASWRLFGWTILAELLILVVPLFLEICSSYRPFIG